jgi:hypothetical protein
VKREDMSVQQEIDALLAQKRENDVRVYRPSPYLKAAHFRASKKSRARQIESKLAELRRAAGYLDQGMGEVEARAKAKEMFPDLLPCAQPQPPAEPVEPRAAAATPAHAGLMSFDHEDAPRQAGGIADWVATNGRSGLAPWALEWLRGYKAHMASQPKARKGVATGARNGNSRLTAEQVAGIRVRIAEGHTNVAIARDFGVTEPTIRRIRRGEGWRR